MISLASAMTDSKGRHARAWLFFDAECAFCTRIAACLRRPMRRRGLALAAMQDPRVPELLGIPPRDVKQAIRLVLTSGQQYVGADAVLAIATEFWWARPVVVIFQVPCVLHAARRGYRWAAHLRGCSAQASHPQTVIEPL
jgi:predicted DCC family thiol-disulfide oxidoreductase YuxK